MARDPILKVRLAVIFACIGASAVSLFAIYVVQISPFSTAAVFAILTILITGSMEPFLKKISRTLESQKLFVSNVAHELRGPMAVMQLDAEAALHNISLAQLSEIKAKELIGAINTDLDGLRQMSNIIKNLSILTSQQYSSDKMEFVKVDLSLVLERLCAVAEREYAYDKSIKIKVENTSPVYVMGNESAIEQMIMNILRNAIHYSDEGTGIVATTEQFERRALLSIRDHGFGISEYDLPHVLDPFYRARHSRAAANTESGTGLGLAIVAALAKQHKAMVSIASVLKKGTTVTLNFPLMPVGT